ncbi:helix-turn-helix transcriptional regulator [Paenirhodobacter populi]|uniref:AlpA family phage regulatory protein n=1 Tax=Paenirhodobacter populi TaxID=2306993 RepID=A0A443J0E9_9RHOB|nr:AlpA family phage regulatory protein [Sinirhodobacter populi]RWR13842.1 AlpA family phage regulatory protein [Sinirhodobacter populi]
MSTARPAWIRPEAICEMLSVSPRTLKRYVATGTFPPPIKLTARTSVWFEHEVIDWMNQKAGGLRAAA